MMTQVRILKLAQAQLLDMIAINKTMSEEFIRDYRFASKIYDKERKNLLKQLKEVEELISEERR